MQSTFNRTLRAYRARHMDPISAGENLVEPIGLGRWRSRAHKATNVSTSLQQKMHKTKQELKREPFVFVHRVHTQQRQTTYNLSPVADGPYEVASLDASTVTIKDGPNIDQVLRNSIAQLPIIAFGTLAILNDASQVIANSNARTFYKKKFTPAGYRRHHSEYVINCIMDYGIAKDRSPLYHVQSYRHGPADNSRELMTHLPWRHVVRFHHLRSLPLPPAAIHSQSQVG